MNQQNLKPTDSGYLHLFLRSNGKIVSEYDQVIPQSQTADNTMALRGRATQPSRDTRKTLTKYQTAFYANSHANQDLDAYLLKLIKISYIKQPLYHCFKYFNLYLEGEIIESHRNSSIYKIYSFVLTGFD